MKELTGNTAIPMKFTELLKNWMDARETYNKARHDEQYDTPDLDRRYEIMINYENQINNVIERLEAACEGY